MKKIFLTFCIISIGIAFWISDNYWHLEKDIENGEVSYYVSYGYYNNGVPLLVCLYQIDRSFSIRIILQSHMTLLHSELDEYYQSNKIKDEKKSFPMAFKSTHFYQNLKNKLLNNGYKLDEEISFEKFSRNDTFYADVYLNAVLIEIK